MSTRLTMPRHSQRRPCARPRTNVGGSAQTSDVATRATAPERLTPADHVPERVYVVDHLLGLGAEGPFMEFRPRDDATGARFLLVYTSRGQIPEGNDRRDAESVPLALLAMVLEPDVRLIVDPGSRGQVVLPQQLRQLAGLELLPTAPDQ